MAIVRKTKAVSAVLSRFEETREAIPAARLVDMLQKQMNKTTVYRILDRLEAEGSLHSFSGANGLKFYAKHFGFSTGDHLSTHPHFQCRKCGRTECVPIDVVVPTLPDRQVDSVSLLLMGWCNDCTV